MPKVYTVKKARKPFKDRNGIQIKKGESYYWWKFRFSPIIKSKTPPEPRDLTRSDYQISLIDVQEQINKLTSDDTLSDQIDEITSSIESLKEEQEERLSNMPEHLQESSSSGQMLQERIDALDNAVSELEGIEKDIEIDDNDVLEKAKEENKNWNKLKEEEQKNILEEVKKEMIEEKAQEIIEEVQNISLE